MTRRTDWKFEYAADVVAAAARAKVEFHAGRLKWWEAQKLEAVKKVQDGGIEVHDGVAAMSYSNSMRGCGPQVVIDATLQRDLEECHGKILEHNSQVKTYECWVQVLEAQGAKHIDLDQDDYLFFFGKK